MGNIWVVPLFHSVSDIMDCRMTDQRVPVWRGCRSRIEVLTTRIPGGNEDRHGKLRTGYPVFRPRFELGVSHIQVKSVTATSPGSVSSNRRVVMVINLLKPTGHAMHRQFNIQQLYVLPALYLCVLYLSENKQRLAPLTA